jgi:hypothetical protein
MPKFSICSDPICFQVEPNSSKFIRLSGKRVNRLFVVGYAFCKNTKHHWNCRCDCGRNCIKSTASLRKGVVSCGCYFTEVVKKRNVTHGHAKTKEHKAYLDAKGRCTCPTNRSFLNYGGRGIEFRFSSFPDFLSAIGYAPSRLHSVDRIDVNGHYEKGNVRWATNTEQQRNKRNNRIVVFNGIEMCAAECEEVIGLKKGRIASRIHQGRPDAVLEKGNLRRKDSRVYDYMGEQKTIPELMHISKDKQDTVRARLLRGWSIHEALHGKRSGKS